MRRRSPGSTCHGERREWGTHMPMRMPLALQPRHPRPSHVTQAHPTPCISALSRSALVARARPMTVKLASLESALPTPHDLSTTTILPLRPPSLADASSLPRSNRDKLAVVDTSKNVTAYRLPTTRDDRPTVLFTEPHATAVAWNTEVSIQSKQDKAHGACLPSGIGCLRTQRGALDHNKITAPGVDALPSPPTLFRGLAATHRAGEGPPTRPWCRPSPLSTLAPSSLLSRSTTCSASRARVSSQSRRATSQSTSSAWPEWWSGSRGPRSSRSTIPRSQRRAISSAPSSSHR